MSFGSLAHTQITPIINSGNIYIWVESRHYFKKCRGSRRNCIKRKREPTMPRPNRRPWESPWCRCNNSSPRYARENHYAISCIKSKISQVSYRKISITLRIFPKCRGKQWLVSTICRCKVNKFLWDTEIKLQELGYNLFISASAADSPLYLLLRGWKL